MKSVCFFLLISLVLTGCAASLPLQEQVSGVDPNRLAFINESNQATFDEAVIDDIIDELNDVLDVNDEVCDYTVVPDENGYIIETVEGNKYRIRIDGNDEFIGASLLSGTDEEKVLFANTVYKVLCEADFDKDEFQERTDETVKQFEAIQKLIKDYIAENNETSLPLSYSQVEE